MEIKQLKTGFTIIELVVAAALFATIVTVAVNLFILALRQPLTEVDNQHVQEEIDFVFEALAANLTDTTIDYSQYSSTISNPQTTLYLLSQGGHQMNIALSGSNIQFTDVTAGWSAPLTTVNTADVAIDSIYFYIYPQSDPSDLSTGQNYQPAVVMRITGHSLKQTQRTFQAQTFVTFRHYVR